MTLLPSGNDLLYQKLNQFKTLDSTRLPRICLIGIGNDLRGDDSVGLIVARTLSRDARFQSAPNFLILEGGPAPENQTGKLRTFQPELVLFVDAAHLDAAPATIQFVPLESIDGMSASSHSLPLSMLAHYISFEFDCKVEVLVIQPAQYEIASKLSPAVLSTVDEVVGLVRNILATLLAS
jgi:hydrogenase 3 maturation protease